MAYPKWTDTKDSAFSKLFNDDFDANKTAHKFTIKSKASNGMKVKVEGKALASGAVEGAFEAKYKFANGVEVKDKWTTANQVETEFKITDKLIEGSTAKLTTKVFPHQGLQNASASGSLEFGKENWGVETEFDGKKFTGSVVAQVKDFLFGVKGDVDTTFKPGSHTLGVQYAVNKEMTASVYAENLDVLRGEFYHQVNDESTYGVKAGYSMGAGTKSFEVCGKYKYDETVTLKSKVNLMNKAVELSFNQAVKPNLSFNVSAALDFANLNAPNHKVGLGVTLGSDK